MKHQKQTLALAGSVLLLLGLLAGCGQQTEAPTLLEPVGVQVQTTTVTRGDLSNVAVYEAVTVPETVACGFLAEGQVDQVLVVRGSEVRAGEVLATLNCDALEEELTQVQQKLSQAQTEQELSQRHYELEKALLEQTGGQDAEAQAALLESQQLQQKTQQDEEMTALEAQAARLQQAIADSSLLAPCDGTVLAVNLTAGDRVQPGAAAVYLADDSSIRVVTEYLGDKTVLEAERVYAAIGGQEYDLTYLPYSQGEYQARRAADEELEATFQVQEPEGVQAGMYTLVYVVAESAQDTLLLPAAAVFQDGAGDYVYQMTADGQVRVDVELGLETQAQVQILSGLEEGAVVYAGY